MSRPPAFAPSPPLWRQTNHEPDVVLAVADDVLLMKPDNLAQFGPLQDIFTAEALSRVYGLPLRLADVDGRKQVL